MKSILPILLTIYWVLFTGVKLSLLLLSPFDSERFITGYIYILHMNLSKRITNSDIISLQIGPDTGNSETFT